MALTEPQTVPAVSLAGVVMLYHPAPDVIGNIRSYLDDVDFLLLVDNSPEPSPTLRDFAASSEKILYHGDSRNHGVAGALNIGAREALRRGYEWLLTMDQDSRFPPGSLPALKASVRDDAGIVSPRHVVAGKADDGATQGKDRDVSYVMTSGNLLNLRAYEASGPFLEKLFIDYVDCEYCLRLRRKGFPVRIVAASTLEHGYGNIEPVTLLGLKFHPTHHAPFRKYYVTRNRLYVMRHYPGFMRVDLWPMIKEWAKILLFEDSRISKIRFAARGAADFFRGRYGPLAER